MWEMEIKRMKMDSRVCESVYMCAESNIPK